MHEWTKTEQLTQARLSRQDMSPHAESVGNRGVMWLDLQLNKIWPWSQCSNRRKRSKNGDKGIILEVFTIMKVNEHNDINWNGNNAQCLIKSKSGFILKNIIKRIWWRVKRICWGMKGRVSTVTSYNIIPKDTIEKSL